MTGTHVEVLSPGQSVERILWQDLRRVLVETNSSGPWGMDVWWVLEWGMEKAILRFPLGAKGEDLFLAYMKSLPGFEVRGMNSTANANFECWRNAAYTVQVVVDPMFGDRLDRLAPYGAVWVIGSETNKRVVKKIWEETRFPLDQFTLFTPKNGETGGDAVVHILEKVDQHHPDWTCIRVYGAPATEAVRGELATAWGGSVEDSEEGFIFFR